MNITATKYPKPILSPGIFSGNLLAHDALWAYHPVVVKKGKTYFMIYTGKSIGPGIGHHTLLATSNNLIDWKKERGELLSNGKEGTWDSDFTAHGFVFGEGKKFFMLYDGSRIGDWLEEIGLAESRDFRKWTKHSSNPVFRVGTSQWEKRHVSRCSMVKHQGEYYLYYAGHDGERERIGLATGNTLLKLNKRLPDPVLDVGGRGAWDKASISDPRVIEYKGMFLLFYSGIDAGGVERTGVATSVDRIHWKKYGGNPILDVTGGGWDSISASRAFPFIDGQKLFLFYSGRRKFFYRIGLAEVSIV